jgi:hypothetical protein
MVHSSGSPNKAYPSTNFAQDRSPEETQRVPIQDHQEGQTAKRLSWNELNKDIEQQDLLIEGRLTLIVDVSIERLHLDRKEQAGNEDIMLGKGWLASLVLSPPGSKESPFLDGESFMQADLHYASEPIGPVDLADAMRALDIDPDAKIWKVQPAP